MCICIVFFNNNIIIKKLPHSFTNLKTTTNLWHTDITSKKFIHIYHGPARGSDQWIGWYPGGQDLGCSYGQHPHSEWGTHTSSRRNETMMPYLLAQVYKQFLVLFYCFPLLLLLYTLSRFLYCRQGEGSREILGGEQFFTSLSPRRKCWDHKDEKDVIKRYGEGRREKTNMYFLYLLAMTINHQNNLFTRKRVRISEELGLTFLFVCFLQCTQVHRGTRGREGGR